MKQELSQKPCSSFNVVKVPECHNKRNVIIHLDILYDIIMTLSIYSILYYQVRRTLYRYPYTNHTLT
jgi:hypothetical protein